MRPSFAGVRVVTTLKLPDPDTVLSREQILELFHGKCVRCRRPAVHVHEIQPKSLLPGDRWKVWTNRVSLCFRCHEWAHLNGTNHSAPDLERLRLQRLQEYYAN